MGGAVSRSDEMAPRRPGNRLDQGLHADLVANATDPAAQGSGTGVQHPGDRLARKARCEQCQKAPIIFAQHELIVRLSRHVGHPLVVTRGFVGLPNRTAITRRWRQGSWLRRSVAIESGQRRLSRGPTGIVSMLRVTNVERPQDCSLLQAFQLSPWRGGYDPHRRLQTEVGRERRFLQSLPHGGEEATGVRAVDEAVVVGQRQEAH